MFEDFPDEALPLIEVSDDRSGFALNSEAVDLLKRIECPICPVSVVGLYRTAPAPETARARRLAVLRARGTVGRRGRIEQHAAPPRPAAGYFVERSRRRRGRQLIIP